MRRSHAFQLRTTIVLAALGCGSLACSSAPGGHAPGAGVADATAGGGSGGSGAVSSGGGTANVAAAGAGVVTANDGLSLPAGEAPQARLQRLTTSQLEHSLQDLLGDGIPLEPVDPDTVVDGFASVGASTVSVSPSGVGLYEDAVRAATDFVFQDAGRLQAELACVPQSASDMACVSQTLAAFGRRAFRRPLTDAELTRFSGLASTIAAQQGGNIQAGLRNALNAILQSPSFLYRVELGAPSAADGGRLKYTDFEMASRLAATLWDSVPDDALLDAAAAGALATPEGVKAQAERLLADPRAHRAIRAFADELYGVSHLEEATKDPAVFPNWSDTLKAAMREELEERVENMVFSAKGDYLSLYDGRTTFVNAELAAYYGLPAPQGSGFQQVTLPADSPRAGLLGAGAILVGHALPQRTSPTERGKFVAESLLCRSVPAPPPNVPPLPAMADASSTLRQRLEAHRSAPQCAACHGLMDPMGFGMEDFDSVGQFRSMDGNQPVDATGTLVGEGLDGSAFDGLAELGAALRHQPVTGPCLVSKLYEEAHGRRAIDLDLASIEALAGTFAQSQNRVDQLLLALVASDAFRFVDPSKG